MFVAQGIVRQLHSNAHCCCLAGHRSPWLLLLLLQVGEGRCMRAWSRLTVFSMANACLHCMMESCSTYLTFALEQAAPLLLPHPLPGLQMSSAPSVP